MCRGGLCSKWTGSMTPWNSTETGGIENEKLKCLKSHRNGSAKAWCHLVFVHKTTCDGSQCCLDTNVRFWEKAFESAATASRHPLTLFFWSSSEQLMLFSSRPPTTFLLMIAPFSEWLSLIFISSVIARNYVVSSAKHLRHALSDTTNCSEDSVG